MELPPRARRILAGEAQRRTNQGTTSACAENTPHQHPNNPARGNYLRVRGEYFCGGVLGHEQAELPPRARRILNAPCGANILMGTTSACAENTSTEPVQHH